MMQLCRFGWAQIVLLTNLTLCRSQLPLKSIPNIFGLQYVTQAIVDTEKDAARPV